MKEYYQDCKEFEMEGIKYYQLLMRCPVCVERDWPTSEEFWYHAKCGGDIYLGDNATFYCSKCHEIIPCSLANFQCPTHGSRSEEYEYIISRAKEFNPFNFGLLDHMAMIMGIASLTRFMKTIAEQEV